MIDARAVEVIGLVALQLLAAMKVRADLDGTTFSIEHRDEAFAMRIRTGGLGKTLLGEEATAGDAAPVLRLRFADSALLFGREPLDSLAALEALGANIVAILPDEDAERVLAEPDRIRMWFEARFPTQVDPTDVELCLGAFDDCVHDWQDASAPENNPEDKDAKDRDVTIQVVQTRLDLLFELMSELGASQASLAEKLGPRHDLAVELAEIARTVDAMQNGILDLAKVRLDDSLAEIPGAARLRVSSGDLEIERSVFRSIAPGLAALLKVTPGTERLSIEANIEGALLVLRLSFPVIPDEARQLCGIVQGIGGIGEVMADGTLTLHLPRSLMLVEVMLAQVGATTLAIPVSHLVEILRPTIDCLPRFGSQRRMLRFQNRLIPIISMGESFGIEGWQRDPTKAILIVVQAADNMVAIQVDMVSDHRHVTVRPIAGGMARPRGVAGAAILSATRLALVVDLSSIAGQDAARRSG